MLSHCQCCHDTLSLKEMWAVEASPIFLFVYRTLFFGWHLCLKAHPVIISHLGGIWLPGEILFPLLVVLLRITCAAKNFFGWYIFCVGHICKLWIAGQFDWYTILLSLPGFEYCIYSILSRVLSSFICACGLAQVYACFSSFFSLDF